VFAFGVVGGYGATGRAVVTELHKSSDGEILIGGRDLEKAKAFAAQFDRRVSSAHVDVFDCRSLDDFCSRSSIVVNCAGPVMALQDRVAQAAFRKRCHYVDGAGLSLVKERMVSHIREIADLRLSFIVSAGWAPGLSEVVPAYAYATAKTRMDTVDSLTVYFGDSGEWSFNALRDAVWYLRQLGLRLPGYYHKGEWTRATMSTAFRKVDVGSPVGPRRFSLFFLPELTEVARRLSDCDVLSFSYLASSRIVLTGGLIALLPIPGGLGVRLLRNAFRRGSLPVGGFVAAEVLGRAAERSFSLTVRVTYDKHRDYWINGLVSAIVARMISEQRGVEPGVHFVADAVDPIAFLAELRSAGLDHSESFKISA